jgi:hypothetical protein
MHYSKMTWLSVGVLALTLVALAGGTRAADSELPKLMEGKAIRLFNGKNLDEWDTVLKKHGRNNDPEHVFTVEDGMVHVAGTDFGHFVTKAEYENYHLIVEFKWGEGTHEGRTGKARDSGVLFHCIDTDKIWGTSVEFQMIEGGTGDCIMVDQATRLENGHPTTKRQDRMNKGPWQDVVGYRDPVAEVEKPHGEWNRLDLIADGDRADYFVNGKKVNHIEGLNPHRGHILCQTEGAEVFFRRVELRPLIK